jgi:hypothetical protein
VGLAGFLATGPERMGEVFTFMTLRVSSRVFLELILNTLFVASL